MTSKEDYSKAYQVFHQTTDQILAFMMLAINTAFDARLDQISEKSPNLLSDSFREARIQVKEDFATNEDFHSFAYENALVSSIAAFEAFLSEILRDILNSEPDLLTLHPINVRFDEEILSASPESLRKYLVEKAVETLLREQISEVLRFLAKLMKKENNSDFDISAHNKLKKALAVRNLLTHRRGIVDQRAKDILGNKVGTRYNLSVKELFEYLTLMSKIAISLNFRSPSSKRAAFVRAVRARAAAVQKMSKYENR